MHTYSFWDALIINSFVVLLRAVVKNPAKYAITRDVFLEIAADITAAFGQPAALSESSHGAGRTS